MSERIPCESCAQPMAAAAARCPHCAALQKRAPPVGVTPRPAGGKRPVLSGLTGDEARALLAVSAARSAPGDAASEDESFNVLAWMFSPDPRSRGAAQVAELVLTVLALPALLSAFVGALFAFRTISRSRRRGGGRAISGALIGVSLVGLSTILSFAGVTFAINVVACAVPALALMLREVVRGRSRRRFAAPDLGA